MEVAQVFHSRIYQEELGDDDFQPMNAVIDLETLQVAWEKWFFKPVGNGSCGWWQWLENAPKVWNIYIYYYRWMAGLDLWDHDGINGVKYY